MMNGYEIAAGALPERTEEELLEAMRAGEREAGDLLVRRCFRLVKSCARPYFLAGADSDDLIQEIYDARHLGEALAERAWVNVLIGRATEGSPALTEALDRA